jgi:hypothetical protein
MSACHNFPVPDTSLSYLDVLNGPHQEFSSVWYLRPDTGGALLPWAYTIIVIVVHAPTVFVRVVKWEMGQTWCLAITLFTVVTYTQAYISTRLNSEQVLTWTPILLVIDAGSMLQLIVLLTEAGSLKTRVLGKWKAAFRHSSQSGTDEYKPLPSDQLQNSPRSPAVSSLQDKKVIPLCKDRLFWTAIAAVILFLAVSILQIYGLVAAVISAKDGAPLVSWCSPLFQPFGIALVDSDCHAYAVTHHTKSKGLGCLRLPGVQQKFWITLTLIVTIIGLVAEALDLIILVFTKNKPVDENQSALWWSRSRRPWFTIFGGWAILGLTLFYGITYAQTLPQGITSRIIVVMDMQNKTTFYAGELQSAGLRGALLGWNDGLFSSWGDAYYGYPNLS